MFSLLITASCLILVTYCISSNSGSFCSKIHKKPGCNPTVSSFTDRGDDKHHGRAEQNMNREIGKQKLERWLWNFQPASFIIVPPLMEMCCSATELILYQGTLSKLLQLGFCLFCKCNKAYSFQISFKCTLAIKYYFIRPQHLVL